MFMQEQELAQQLVQLLSRRGFTCATAESCTGGLVAAAITSIPGASAVFAGGAVTYNNDMKQLFASVKAEDITAFSAVSPQIAAQMAAGIRAKTGVSLAVSTTGNAGPQPSEGKPVGMVFVAVDSPWFSQTVQLPPQPPGIDREEIRHQTVVVALEQLLLAAQHDSHTNC